MKKILCIGLALTMVMSISMTSLATTNDFTEEMIETPANYQKYIQSLANKLGVSIKEAEEIDKTDNQIYEKGLRKRYPELFDSAGGMVTQGFYSYPIISKTQSYNQYFAAAVHIQLKIYKSGSFGEIVKTMGNGVYSSRISGWGNYDWIQLNSWDDPYGGSYPTIGVIFSATGQFRVEVAIGYEVGVELYGFTASLGPSETLIYLSPIMEIRCDYSLYY